MSQDRTKKQIIAEFDAMKGVEECAYELYAKIAADPQMADEKVRSVFAAIAADEKRHIGLVQRIIDIATNQL